MYKHTCLFKYKTFKIFFFFYCIKIAYFIFRRNNQHVTFFSNFQTNEKISYTTEIFVSNLLLSKLFSMSSSRIDFQSACLHFSWFY